MVYKFFQNFLCLIYIEFHAESNARFLFKSGRVVWEKLLRALHDVYLVQMLTWFTTQIHASLCHKHQLQLCVKIQKKFKKLKINTWIDQQMYQIESNKIRIPYVIFQTKWFKNSLYWKSQSIFFYCYHP